MLDPRLRAWPGLYQCYMRREEFNTADGKWGGLNFFATASQRMTIKHPIWGCSDMSPNYYLGKEDLGPL